jgi:RNA polymerase sigma factor (sigma-70 family)
LPPSINFDRLEMRDEEAWIHPSAELTGLLNQVKGGDMQAFEVFNGRTSALVFGIILQICRNAGRAEEVVQEVYVTVWRRAGTFEAAKGEAVPWLLQIARNRAIDSIRNGLRDALDAASYESDEVLDLVPCPRPDPLTALISKGDAQAVQRCSLLLSGHQRQCLQLAFVRGLSHSEIAVQLEQPLGTVKSWIRRALITIKFEMDWSDHAVPPDPSRVPAG